MSNRDVPPVKDGWARAALYALTPLLDKDATAWQERSSCAQSDPEAFFPEKGGSTRDAKRVCMSCEVRAECLEYALDNDERFGIWGGMSERERRRLKRRSVPASPGETPSSRFRGVSWAAYLGKWRARAYVDGDRVYLGVFADEEEAGRAVAEAEDAPAADSLIPQPTKAVA